jgi:spore maturation protein CgeB
MSPNLRITFFGSSLVSSYWNGAATYYRGIVRALAERGHQVTFCEPDIYDRQQHRDMADPEWAHVAVYPGHDEAALHRTLEKYANADLLIKASGIGEFDELLEAAVLEMRVPHTAVAFWDVDAPATLERITQNPLDPFRALIPRYDLILTYGGGDNVVNAYTGFGARRVEVVYNALDPLTHHTAAPDPRFVGDLGLLANRLPDREARIEEFFLHPAARSPERRFVLGGNGWHQKSVPWNVNCVGHVGTADHNAFNNSSLAVLNVSRDSMARCGFSPPTRVFEAAGAAACLITDFSDGIEMFLEPEREVLVARNGDEVLAHLESLTPAKAQAIGKAACSRVLAEHTYAHRALQLETLLQTASFSWNGNSYLAKVG